MIDTKNALTWIPQKEISDLYLITFGKNKQEHPSPIRHIWYRVIQEIVTHASLIQIKEQILYELLCLIIKEVNYNHRKVFNTLNNTLSCLHVIILKYPEHSQLSPCI